MKIEFCNPFHGIKSTLDFFTSNRQIVQLSGKKVRRFLEEMCQTDGCDCFKDLSVTVDSKPAVISWIDPDAEDEKPGIEILLAPRTDER